MTFLEQAIDLNTADVKKNEKKSLWKARYMDKGR